jgi:hypothetical protein
VGRDQARGYREKIEIEHSNAVKRSVDDWKRDLQGRPPEVANEMIVADGSADAYEAFVALYTEPPFAPQARLWLDRHRRMVAWNNAVSSSTPR